MPATLTSPNMSIVTPVALTQIGPAWAQNLQAALFTTVDAHDHSSGKGVQITPAGMNINADLPFGTFNATNLRSARFVNQIGGISLGSDINCLYSTQGSIGSIVYNGDAFWNNSSGQQIALSARGFVAPAPADNVKFLTTAYVIPSNENITQYWCDPSLVTSLTLPQASTLLSGRRYIVVDYKGTSATNPIVLTPNGTDKINGVNAPVNLSLNFGMWLAFTDGNVTGWILQGITSSYLTGKPPVGTRGSQAGTVQGGLYYLTTTSTATTTFATIPVPTGRPIMWTIRYTGVNTSGANMAFGQQFVAAANNAGTVNVAGITIQSGSVGVSPFTAFAITPSGTNALLQVTPAVATSTDWQFDVWQDNG